MLSSADLFVYADERLTRTKVTLQLKLRNTENAAIQLRDRSEKLKEQITYLRTLFIDSLSTRWNARMEALVSQFQSIAEGNNEVAKRWADEVDRLYALAHESRPIPTVASMGALRQRCWEFGRLFNGVEFDAYEEARYRLKLTVQDIITALEALMADQRLRDAGRAPQVDKRENARQEIVALQGMRAMYKIVKEICDAMERTMIENVRKAHVLDGECLDVEKEIELCEAEVTRRRGGTSGAPIIKR